MCVSRLPAMNVACQSVHLRTDMSASKGALFGGALWQRILLGRAQVLGYLDRYYQVFMWNRRLQHFHCHSAVSLLNGQPSISVVFTNLQNVPVLTPILLALHRNEAEHSIKCGECGACGFQRRLRAGTGRVVLEASARICVSTC